MKYNKMKKAELIDLLIAQDEVVNELLGQIEWAGDVERQADKRIEEVSKEGINLIEDVLYKLRWVHTIEDDPKKALEDTIRSLSDYIYKNS